MDLSAKYEKIGLIGGNETRVWRGREYASGRTVLLHQFASNPSLMQLAVQYLLQGRTAPVVDCGELEGATCLVTVDDLELLDLDAWLGTAMRRRSGDFPDAPDLKTEIVQAPGSSILDAPPGEFTILFNPKGSSRIAEPARRVEPAAPSPQWNEPRPEVQRPDVAPKPGGRQTVSDAPPGEFTVMFGPGELRPERTPAPPTWEIPAVAHRPPAPTPSAAPGEYTQLFGRQASQQLRDDLKVAIQRPVLPQPTAERSAYVPSPPLPDEPKRPTEYTQVIRGRGADSSKVPPQVPAEERASSPLSVNMQMPGMSAPSVPSMPSIPQTQSIPQAPSLPQPPSYSAPSLPASAGVSGLSPVVVLFVALLATALILVLVVVLRRA